MPLRWLVLVTAFAVFALQSAPAEAAKRIALVVANAAYKDAPLGNPTVDARLIEPALKAAGFEVTLVLDADLSRFDGAVETFATQAQQAEVALFYFAGHGFAVNDGLIPRNYLMSTDAIVGSPSERLLKAGGIPLDEIVQRLSGAAKTTLVFVDACRNDPRAKRGTGGTRGLARMETGGIPNLFVAVSTRLGEQALDGTAGSGSPFARAFALEIPKAGVRIDDAFASVRRTVNAETIQQQKPEIIQDDLDAPLVLVALPGAAEPAQAALQPPPPPSPAPALAPVPKPADDSKASALTYLTMTGEPYFGQDNASFIGAWIRLYNPEVDNQRVRDAIAFEITGNFPRKQPEAIDYSIGISDARTVKYFSPAYVDKADIGKRFFIDDHSIRTGRWKKVFQSMDASDQRIMAGICKSISQPDAENKILQTAADASKQPQYNKTFQDFWQVPKHRQGIIALGKSCYAAIKGIVKSSDDAFAKAN